MLEVNSFKTLSDDELLSIDGGGLFLAILCGIGTVAATVGAAIAAPPGTKAAAAFKIARDGCFLTGAVYLLD